MSWLGLDIGGANLKAANEHGWAESRPFALWRDPAGLTAALSSLIRQAPTAGRLAVTMTGELCDCFRTKAEGVRHILAAVDAAAPGNDVHVYLVDGRFVSTVEACEQPRLAAASNWHALASFAARYTDGGAALVIDIGSTTSDIVPLSDGRPATDSQSDSQRLLARELVYTGVGRTPICAVTNTLTWKDRECPVTAELFATTADAYLLLGLRQEEPDATWTADGQPLTREFAHERLARMVCGDSTTVTIADAARMAERVASAQLVALDSAVSQVVARMAEPPKTIVVSGSGEFLARRLAITAAAGKVVSLAAELGEAVSRAAAALAVATLAEEQSERSRRRTG